MLSESLFPTEAGSYIPLVNLYKCLPSVECDEPSKACLLTAYMGYTGGEPYDYVEVEEPYDCLAQKGYYEVEMML